MKRKFLPIVITSILLGTLADVFFYAKQPGISLFLFSSLVLFTTFYLTHTYKVRPPKVFYALAVLVLFFSSLVFVRASGFLSFLNIFMVLYLMLLMLTLLAHPGSSLRNFSFFQYVTRLSHLPFKIIREFFEFIRKLLDKSNQPKEKRSWQPVVRGIVLALPFLFVFLLLFSSADLVFNEYIGSLVDFKISPEFFSHLLWIGLFTSIFLGGYALLFTRSSPSVLAERAGKKLNIGTIETSIILGSIAFLFLVFVLIQIAYLFGGQGHITAAGFTYAEYARKGFFELITVAVITLLLILAANDSTVRQTLKQKVTFMWLSGVLIVEVLVIMLSAHKRLTLYEQAYGFTDLRLYSHIFIAWLAVVFVGLLIHIIREQRENVFAFQMFISVIAFLAFINLLNPDAFIARRNIERFNQTGKIDTHYLSTLSEDATPELVKLLDHPNGAFRGSVAYGLYLQKSALDRNGSHWQSFNISRDRAKDLLQKDASKLNSHGSFFNNVDD